MRYSPTAFAVKPTTLQATLAFLRSAAEDSYTLLNLVFSAVPASMLQCPTALFVVRLQTGCLELDLEMPVVGIPPTFPPMMPSAVRVWSLQAMRTACVVVVRLFP